MCKKSLVDKTNKNKDLTRKVALFKVPLLIIKVAQEVRTDLPSLPQLALMSSLGNSAHVLITTLELC